MAKDKIKVEQPKTRKKVSGYGLLGTKYKKNPKYRDKPRNKRIDIREMNDVTLDPFEQAIREIEKEFGINLQEQTDDELGPNPLDLDDELQGRERNEPEFGTPEFRDMVRKQYHDARDREAVENEEDFDPHAMSDDQMSELVGFVHDDLLGGQPADPRDVESAFHQALDDVPGFEMGERDDVMGRLMALYNQLYGRERM